MTKEFSSFGELAKDLTEVLPEEITAEAPCPTCGRLMTFSAADAMHERVKKCECGQLLTP